MLYQKIKKKLNYNYIRILFIALIGLLFGILAGFRLNMLKVHAVTYTEEEYLEYGQQQYNSGITQGQDNVISNPGNYGLYTEQQYINNSNYSDFLFNQIDSVWINQPIRISTNVIRDNWSKINKNTLVISDGTIQLNNIFTYINITNIRIYYKSYFTNDIALSFNNITDPSLYSNNYLSVGLHCYNQLPTTSINDVDDNRCQTVPGASNSDNFLELEYSYLINNVNYFTVLTTTSDYSYTYFNYIKYNCIEIRTYNTSSSSINYLNSSLNTINYDLSAINLTSYNMGYEKGFGNGQLSQQQAKYNEGYNDGYNKAEQLYADTSGNGNTLVGLVGTILFSPVLMLKTIFNFDILGINLAGFILSIITLIVVIWLIKRLI